MRDARHPGPGTELECGPHSQVLQIEDIFNIQTVFLTFYIFVSTWKEIHLLIYVKIESRLSRRLSFPLTKV